MAGAGVSQGYQVYWGSLSRLDCAPTCTITVEGEHEKWLSSSPLTPDWVPAVPHLFGRCSKISKWISLLYSLGALYTTVFWLCPRANKVAHFPRSEIPPCFRLPNQGEVLVYTVPSFLLLISMWSVYCLLCESVKSVFSSSSGGIDLYVGVGSVCPWKELSLGYPIHAS